jgi:phage terminase small subunit
MPEKKHPGGRPKTAELLKLPSFQELSDKHRLFVVNLIKENFNQSQAYIATYGKETEEFARINASRLLTDANIKESIQDVMNMLLESEKLTLEKKIIQMYMHRAFYDPSDILDENGDLKVSDLKELPDSCRYAIEGIESKTTYGKDDTVIDRKIKLANREKALEMLSKYMQIMADRLVIDFEPDLLIE